jgi:type IV secretion system protein VirB10
MPRQVQTWILVGVAVVMLLIISLAGNRSSSVPAPQATLRTAPAPYQPSNRILPYEQQLNDDIVRAQHLQALTAAAVGQAAGSTPGSAAGAPAPTVTDQIAEDQRRRDYQSLFADNVVLSRRTAGQQPTGDSGQRRAASAMPSGALSPEMLAALAMFAQAQTANAARAGESQVAPPLPSESQASADGRVRGYRDAEHADVGAVGRPLTGSLATVSAPPPTALSAKVHDENPAPGPRLRLLEGTVIETVLLNRLDGTFAGPVECLVTTPVYSHDRQVVLIPAGARVLGAAAPVQSRGDSRLAVSFNRLVMPDGHSYSLEAFKGLDQSGATGITDEVNRHYMQVFGASLAIGAVSGLAQYSTRGADATTFSDAYRQSAGASLATSTSNVLDRYLNVLPTITIREGFRIKVYLTNDFDLPAYAGTGGIQ